MKCWELTALYFNADAGDWRLRRGHGMERTRKRVSAVAGWVCVPGWPRWRYVAQSGTGWSGKATLHQPGCGARQDPD
jgi:hypothetical protein